MSRTTSQFVCDDCDVTSLRWVGRCPGCGSWNSLRERHASARVSSSRPAPAACALVDVVSERSVVWASGVAELDRVLGGGFVPGSTTLLFGEPGIGKSTLALMALRSLALDGATTLLVAAEESAVQVASRARRLGPVPPSLLVAATTDVTRADELVRSHVPALVVVDSVSAMRDEEVTGVVGSVAQVRQAAERLCASAKDVGSALVLVGHVTKDGELSGPRALEHLVDTVVRIEGDRADALRLVRTLKHRFGSTDEVGILEMGPEGLRTLDDPSGRSRLDAPDVAGVATTVTTDGTRSVVVEVQALVATSTGSPRRVAHRVSSQRLALLLAILEARCDVNVSDRDVFAATAGGLAATEPANDLALALAVASAARGFAVPRAVAAVGEVSLTGELRPVNALARRAREAARLGARVMLVPFDSECDDVDGLVLMRCRTLAEALSVARRGVADLW